MIAFLLYLVPLVVASVITPLYDRLQQSVAILRQAPAIVSRILVGVLAFVGTKIASLVIALTGADVALVMRSDVGALFAASLSYLFHLSDRTKAAQG